MSTQSSSPSEGTTPAPTEVSPLPAPASSTAAPAAPEEIGGKKRLEPTRYGDWELNGKCVDF